MSGGVGPSSDIHLPKEETETETGRDEAELHHHHHPTTTKRSTSDDHIHGGRFFTLRQVNALALITVLASSGLVSVGDFLLVLFSSIYVFFLSKFAFPKHSPRQEEPVFAPDNKFLRLYILIAAIIGLYVPICYLFEGIYEGDKEGIKAAAPHVFLLSTQVFMEGFTASLGLSIPIRVFVPVFYNAWRVLAIVDWMKKELDFLGGGKELGMLRAASSERRLYVGKLLAVANFGFWCFNLFGFLLPVYLPRAFKRYYSSEGSSKAE